VIIIDTGPLVALFDKDDQYHNLCKKSLKLIKEPLITNWPVLTESMYLLSFSPVAQDLCLEFIESAGIIVRGGDSQEMPRIQQLMKQYKDLPIDFTDASIGGASPGLVFCGAVPSATGAKRNHRQQRGQSAAGF